MVSGVLRISVELLDLPEVPEKILRKFQSFLGLA
jgi:hypothetical protein